MKYVISLVIPLYLIFSFVQWNFDCGSWSKDVRIFWVMLYAILVVMLNIAERIFKKDAVR